MNEISDKTIYNWERRISKGKKLSDIRIDAANIRYKMDYKNPVKVLKTIHGKMAIAEDLITSI